MNKLLVRSQKHNYIPYSTFTITTVQLHVSAINVGHLQFVHEAPYDKLYLHVSGGTLQKIETSSYKIHSNKTQPHLGLCFPSGRLRV